MSPALAADSSPPHYLGRPPVVTTLCKDVTLDLSVGHRLQSPAPPSPEVLSALDSANSNRERMVKTEGGQAS